MYIWLFCLCVFVSTFWWNIQVQVASLFDTFNPIAIGCTTAVIIWWGIEKKCSQTTEQNSSVHSINYSTKLLLLLLLFMSWDFFHHSYAVEILMHQTFVNQCNVLSMPVCLYCFCLFCNIFQTGRYFIFTFT